MLQEIQLTNFTAGELSPRMKGRTDYAKYFSGLATQQNMVTMPQGGSTRRPGTAFSALSRDQNATPFRVRNISFVFSSGQAYQLEFGDRYIAVFMNGFPVLSGGSPVIVVTPYLAADIWAIQHIQSADTLFLTCGVGGAGGAGYAPMTLTRSSNTSWSLAAFAFTDGPYLSQNLQPSTTLTPDPATIGATAITAAVLNTANGEIELTVASTAGFVSGQRVAVSQVKGTIEANGAWTAAVVDATHVNLSGSHFANAYLSGGVLYYSIGAVTLNASTAAGINGGAGFRVSDVGRQLRFQSTDGGKTLWLALTIASVPSTTQVTATIQPASATADAVPQGVQGSSVWALGAFTATLGYPDLCAFWQDRLLFLGSNALPNGVWASNTGAFNLFGPSLPDGTVVASNAFLYAIADGDPQGDSEVDAIRWVCLAGSAQALQLGIGLSGSEDIMQAAATGQPLGPTNVQVYQETAYGSAANVPPLRIGKSLIFADRTARKLREWSFYWQNQGYLGPDKTEYCEHITRGLPGSPRSSSGVRWLCYQQSPYQVIWAGRNDGGLVSFTYDRDEQIWAAAQHPLGGQYYGGAPIVESGCVIPSPDGSYDQLWLVVLRTIAGAPTRFIEVMQPYFEGDLQDNAWFVDCGLASALSFPNATLTPPGNLTPTARPRGYAVDTMPAGFTGSGNFAASAAVFAGNSTDIGKVIRVNNGKALVTAPIDTTHVTATVQAPLASLTPQSSGNWSCSPPVGSFSGMSYANGETVAVLADGADGGSQVMSGGTVNLATAATYAVAGFPSTPALVTMPFEPLKAAQAISGKVKSVQHLYLRLHESGAPLVGRRLTDEMTDLVRDVLQPVGIRQASGDASLGPPIYSGVKRILPVGGYDKEGQIIITIDAPLPLTVLGINASAEVGDLPAGA